MESSVTLRGAYRCLWCQAAEYGKSSPEAGGDSSEVPGVAAGAGLLVAVEAAGGAPAPGLIAAGDAALAAGDDVDVTGEVPGAGEAAGLAAGEAAGLLAAGEPAGGAAAGDPPAAGLAPAAGAFWSSAGARLPMFDRSGPMRIFPINAGRSKT